MIKFSDDIIYVGVNDRKIDLFEGMYSVPNGVAYNSYVIVDEKIAVMDSVDKCFGEEWLGKVESALNGRNPDYLVVLHMEPDHSANIARFMEKYPNVKIVGNSKTFVMVEEFFGKDFVDRRVTVNDGDKLVLGKHALKFIFAPMVHWRLTRKAKRFCFPLTLSGNSARTTRTKSGTPKPADTISASWANTDFRFRRCSKNFPVTIYALSALCTDPF